MIQTEKSRCIQIESEYLDKNWSTCTNTEELLQKKEVFEPHPKYWDQNRVPGQKAKYSDKNLFQLQFVNEKCHLNK